MERELEEIPYDERRTKLAQVKRETMGRDTRSRNSLSDTTREQVASHALNDQRRTSFASPAAMR